MESAMIENVIVLDKGFVQYVDHMGDDLTIVNAARVSFNKQSEWEGEQHWTGAIKDKKLSERDQKLIKYLATHKHWTPFAHTQITIRIKTPIFIRAQLGKHQVGLVMNEVSRRYVSDPPSVYMPRWRGKPTNGAKQGSEDFMPIDDQYNTVNRHYEFTVKEALQTYEELLKRGVAPEQARSVLPQGTYTEWWWTGSLAAFARVVAQRSDSHAQWECQQYAHAIATIIQPPFPHSWAALTPKEPSQPS
jgi:thymidylate synthase (FAD)